MSKIQVIRYIAIFCVFASIHTSCVTVKNTLVSRDIQRTLKKSPVFRNQFTGFALYDPAEQEFICRYNSDLFFTPASNTKILTALASIEALRDSIPTFLYARQNDTIYLEPLGDPTLLHADFPSQPVIEKLKNKTVLVHFPEEVLPPFGPGWAWDDYEFDFQTERSWLPVYGNEVRIYNDHYLHVVPDFFKDYVSVHVGTKPGSRVYRERKFNLFNIWMETETSPFQRKIPFDYSEELALSLLADTLNTPIIQTRQLPDLYFDTLYNQQVLPALSLMMQRSDNFLAEQFLLVAARQSGYTNTQLFRSYKLQKWGFLPSSVQWVDGSGLSRYNLITPEALVAVLERIYNTIEWKAIKSVFPAGGESGTLKYWYYGDPTYVYAKTGTLSNNHNLIGYILTRSGRILIFSLMNNHYIRPVSEVKKEMQTLLEGIRDAL